jgi:hypothetical protein
MLKAWSAACCADFLKVLKEEPFVSGLHKELDVEFF